MQRLGVPTQMAMDPVTPYPPPPPPPLAPTHTTFNDKAAHNNAMNANHSTIAKTKPYTTIQTVEEETLVAQFSLPNLPAWLLFTLLFLFLPTQVYINRGYTQWFHGLSLLFPLCRDDDWFARFLAVQGFSITAGWYASLLTEWFLHGRFAHILYLNMPDLMKQFMMIQDTKDGAARIYHWAWWSSFTTTPTTTTESLGTLIGSDVIKVLSHGLDLVGHPLLTYYYWRYCWRRGHDWHSITTWSVCVATYALSRIWSWAHCRHNYHDPSEEPGQDMQNGALEWWQHDWFYFGYHVYVIPPDSLHLWLPAYVTEGLLYLTVLLYKILYRWHLSVS